MSNPEPLETASGEDEADRRRIDQDFLDDCGMETTTEDMEELRENQQNHFQKQQLCMQRQIDLMAKREELIRIEREELWEYGLNTARRETASQQQVLQEQQQLEQLQEHLQREKEKLRKDQQQVLADQMRLKHERKQLQRDREQLRLGQLQLGLHQMKLLTDKKQFQKDRKQLHKNQEELQQSLLQLEIRESRLRAEKRLLLQDQKQVQLDQAGNKRLLQEELQALKEGGFEGLKKKLFLAVEDFLKDEEDRKEELHELDGKQACAKCQDLNTTVQSLQKKLLAEENARKWQQVQMKMNRDKIARDLEKTKADSFMLKRCGRKDQMVAFAELQRLQLENRRLQGEIETKKSVQAEIEHLRADADAKKSEEEESKQLVCEVLHGEGGGVTLTFMFDRIYYSVAFPKWNCKCDLPNRSAVPARVQFQKRTDEEDTSPSDDPELLRIDKYEELDLRIELRRSDVVLRARGMTAKVGAPERCHCGAKRCVKVCE